MSEERIIPFSLNHAITSKLGRRGWYAYKSTDSTKESNEETIRRGPAKYLEVLERYCIFPIAKNPNNPEEVMGALERFAISVNREMPSIEIQGERFPWTGFMPRSTDVKVNTTMTHYLLYHEFIESLKTITPANNKK